MSSKQFRDIAAFPFDRLRKSVDLNGKYCDSCYFGTELQYNIAFQKLENEKIMIKLS